MGMNREEALQLWWGRALLLCSKLGPFHYLLTALLKPFALMLCLNITTTSVFKGEQPGRTEVLITADTKPSVGLSKSDQGNALKKLNFIQGTISGEQDPYQMATTSSKNKGLLTLG